MTTTVHAESDARVDPIAARQGHCLRTTGLVKSFRGRKVVKGVAVEVYAGEVVGLLGPNGAGKTTIFDM
ncbi:MAG: ATP-binding cassette domain-containing protein, partial [Nitrospirota bacterium]